NQKYMQSITFECEVITPMFLAGADGSTPELRPPSIKGALRFWWRALNGHLALGELKKRETAIFGGTDNGGGRSIIIIQAKPINTKTGVEILIPHKNFMKATAFKANETIFEVKLSLMKTVKDASNSFEIMNYERLKSLFLITATLGGFGKRSRRGMGSVNIIKCSEQFKQPNTLQEILPHLHQFSQFFELYRNERIYNTYTGTLGLYGCLREVAIGEPEEKTETLLKHISDTTHKEKEKDPYRYAASIGNAFGGRMASSVYVSIIKGSALPIVSTLNIAVNRNSHHVSTLVQSSFVKEILNK
ncbi:MAG: type III-B CRISPR module RAMP protein Cmr1, partial [Emticicia sp.]|nr:type III-B CRISPR module RAMP protein Cmr1 [Emticicia sp.]